MMVFILLLMFSVSVRFSYRKNANGTSIDFGFNLNC